MKLIEILFGILIVVITVNVWVLEQQDADVALKLAEDYAEMLEREAACETWECIQNVEME